MAICNIWDIISFLHQLRFYYSLLISLVFAIAPHHGYLRCEPSIPFLTVLPSYTDGRRSLNKTSGAPRNASVRLLNYVFSLNICFYQDVFPRGRNAALSLSIAIVGCGLGGLAAAYCLGRVGHKVTVFESASAISEIGAGIQVRQIGTRYLSMTDHHDLIQLGPNLSRLLIRWGLGEHLKQLCVKPQAVCFRRCRCSRGRETSCLISCYTTDENGDRVGWTKWGENMDKDHGAPYYHIHVSFVSEFLYSTNSWPFSPFSARGPTCSICSLIWHHRT